MNKKPLDITKPMQTRNGWEAKLICNDLAGNSPLGVRIKRQDGTEFVTSRLIDGRCWDHTTSDFDIINVPTKIVRYLNFYGPEHCFMYDTRPEADEHSSPNRIACIRVEFTEGQFDD